MHKLEFRDVTLRYDDGRHGADGLLALEKLSLAVDAGESLAIIGPSGCGKSSTLQMAAGLVRPSSGEVLVDGEPLPKRGPCPVQLIGQHPELTLDPRMRMAASLAECGASEEELDRLRELLGIRGAWLSRYPHELSGLSLIHI